MSQIKVILEPIKSGAQWDRKNASHFGVLVLAKSKMSINEVKRNFDAVEMPAGSDMELKYSTIIHRMSQYRTINNSGSIANIMFWDKKCNDCEKGSCRKCDAGILNAIYSAFGRNR
ncbi:MAG: hypothetical protein LBJ18_00730 [Rickettsiales bacterium]|jgi:predicted metal-binding protein|nr:hypothetical protein [Rickettsiales bacterium]